MNSTDIEKASTSFAERLKKESGGDMAKAVDLAYRLTLSRGPTPDESQRSLAYIGNDPARLKNFAWVMSQSRRSLLTCGILLSSK